jgi:hypothetical protein
VSNETERAWKKAVVWQFKVLYQYVLGWPMTSTSELQHFFFFDSIIFGDSRATARVSVCSLCCSLVLLQIAARPGSHNLRCLFRVAFVPRDACDLAQRDLVAFEYLYMQVRNVVMFSTVTLV